MKNFSKILVVALMAFVAVGCGKVEKVIVKKDGKWDVVTETYRYYSNNNLDSTVVENGTETYTFQDDGTGTATDGATTDNFTWSVNADGDVITLCYDFLGAQLCLPMEVLESSSKSQIWMNTSESGTAGTYIESEVSLERAE